MVRLVLSTCFLNLGDRIQLSANHNVTPMHPLRDGLIGLFYCIIWYRRCTMVRSALIVQSTLIAGKSGCFVRRDRLLPLHV